MKQLTFDAAPPHLSPIPASALCRIFGSPGNDTDRKREYRWPAFSATACDWHDREPWRLPDPLPSPQEQLEVAEETARLACVVGVGGRGGEGEAAGELG